MACSEYEITNEGSEEYNCIAWALGITGSWWGFQNPGDYWPPSLPRNQEVGTIMRLFANEGCSLCDDDAPEPGYEKIALFSFVGQFTHVARQLENSQWTSKLGNREIITHQATANLAGSFYGNVHCIMRRSNP